MHDISINQRKNWTTKKKYTCTHLDWR